jgi:tetratricopeptide (TPR) repeat protein
MRIINLQLAGLIALVAAAADVQQPEWFTLLHNGQTLNEQEKYTEAVQTLQAAREAAVRENASELQQTEIMDALGAAYEKTDNLQQAQTAFDRALAIRRKLLPDPDAGPAISLTNESSLFWALGKPSEAREYATKAKLMWEQLGQIHRWEYAAAINNLVAAYRLEGRVQEAVPLMQQACEIYRRNFPAASPRLIRALTNLALGFKDLGQYERAEEVLNEALRDARGAEEGASAEQMSTLLSALGDLKNIRGQYGEAERFLRDAIALTRNIPKPNSLQLSAEHNNLGCVLRALGRTDEAQQEFVAALKSVEGIHGQADIRRAEILNNEGLLAQSKHDLRHAEQLFQQAVDAFESALGQGGPSSVPAYANLAGLYGARHQYAKAERVFELALDRDRSVLPKVHPAIARDLNNLGWIAFKRRHYDRAEALFRESLDIFKKTLGPEHVDTAITEGNLANTLCAMKRTDGVQQLYDEEIQVLERAWGRDNPKLIETLGVYAKFLRANAQSAKAEEAETHALRIRVKQAIVADQGRPRS